MNLFARLFNRGKTEPFDPNQQVSSWFPVSRFIPSNLSLTPEEQVSLSAVYGCVRVISEALASSPWNVYVRAEERRELLTDDPVAYLLNTRPNAEVTAQSFREAMVFQAMVHGNSYAEIVKDTAGRIVELVLIPTERVQVTRAETGELAYVVSQPSGDQLVLLPSQVFHLRALSSVVGLMGDSVIARAAKAIAVAHASERFALNYYGSNATVGGILKIPRALKPDEQASLEAGFNTDRAGVQKAFRTLALPPGTEFQPISHDADKAQVIPARQFSIEEVIRYFGVPPHLLGVSVASQGYGRNLNELGLTFSRHTLTPWKKRLEQEANFKLFPQRAPWKFSEIDFAWLTMGDAQSVASTFSIYLDKGVYSINEVREKLGENDIGPDGDSHKGTQAPEPAGGNHPLAGQQSENGMDAGASGAANEGVMAG